MFPKAFWSTQLLIVWQSTELRYLRTNSKQELEKGAQLHLVGV